MLVPKNLRIVPGLNHIGVARCKLKHCAVFMRHAHHPRLNDAHVPVLTAIRFGNRLYAFRPSPARLHREPGRGRAAEAHDVYLSLVGSPTLVGGVEIKFLNAGHFSLLVVQDRWRGISHSRSRPSKRAMLGWASVRECHLSGTLRLYPSSMRMPSLPRVCAVASAVRASGAS